MSFQLSIRRKITYGFYLLLLFMVAAAVLAAGLVRKIEEKIILAEVIEDVLNTTLEIRRFEKNFFLYHQHKDFEENRFYLNRLKKLFLEKADSIRSLQPGPSYALLVRKIGLYGNDMNQYQRLVSLGVATPERARLEERIRRTGKELTDFAELAVARERRAIKGLLQAIRTILVFSALFLVVLAVVILSLLGRSVVQSLRTLEGYTRKISQGEFVEQSVSGNDSEISSLLKAFNRMNIELRMRQQQLVQSEKLAALGTLLSGVAHELNNPLSNISTSAQILAEELEEADPEFKKNLISQIEEQTDKARDIVRTLLEFSRIKEFHKEKLPLRTLLEETILLIRGQVPTEVEILVEVDDDLQVIADKQRLQQVFLNLIKNSIDAMGPAGHIWLSARRTRKESGQSEVEILVEDDGPGIPPEVLKNIFDPFFTTKDVGHGSGLGLFVVHDIIESHGGTITVDSRPGTGTTFIIWLPDEPENKETAT